MSKIPKRQRGRPVKKPLPKPIDDSPENVMRAILATPPKQDQDWRYTQNGED